MPAARHGGLGRESVDDLDRTRFSEIALELAEDPELRAAAAEVVRLGGDDALRAVMQQASNQMVASLTLHRSLASLSGTVTPAAAARSAATDSLWKRIDHEFGLLTSQDVRHLVGAGGRGYASDARRDGRLMGVKRINSILYPGFQFDGGHPRPLMRQLHHEAGKHEVPEEAVLLWLASPTTWWGDDLRPVDHLDDEQGVLESFRMHFGAEW